jgi:hypothetical protein
MRNFVVGCRSSVVGKAPKLGAAGGTPAQGYIDKNRLSASCLLPPASLGHLTEDRRPTTDDFVEAR